MARETTLLHHLVFGSIDAISRGIIFAPKTIIRHNLIIKILLRTELYLPRNATKASTTIYNRNSSDDG